MVLALCRRGLVILICLYLLVGREMTEERSRLKNESYKTKKKALLQRINVALPLTMILIYKKVAYTFLTILSLLCHINQGIEEIMADHIHQEMTRNCILVHLRCCFLIIIKDLFVSLLSGTNESKNLMVSDTNR